MAFRDHGKKAWEPRAQVGMIGGKNDETKGFKVYLPKDSVVITTQHIRNVDTLNNEQIAQLQTQFEREDPELRSAVAERDEVAKRKESATKGSQSETPVVETSPIRAEKLHAGKPPTTRSKKKKARMAKKKKKKKKNLLLGTMLCYTDSCLYIEHEANVKTLVGIYVADVLVTGTSVKKVDYFFNDMKVVELNDIGVVTKFLGIVFDNDVEVGWTLSQEAVNDEMLEMYGLAEAAPVHVPISGEDSDEGVHSA
ncbi:Copia LTR rider [Phytophthora cinnamomi]|uniref:Copia LTR rider n=1 Tax=Phytophthora cinnamomi TaxID=4785 RepID=UPI003559DB8A|nr:Copia LTR rider [Phytophthora cinnamomi]